MGEFGLGTKVKIIVNQKEGQIVGIWHQLGGPVLYNVRYINSLGSILTEWLRAEDLAVTE